MLEETEREYEKAMHGEPTQLDQANERWRFVGSWNNWDVIRKREMEAARATIVEMEARNG